MLNRRILRIKAFKAMYAQAENPSITAAEALTSLDESCEATRDLYLFLLAAVPALTSEAAARIEAARSKFNPTEEEARPNMKFARNTVAEALSSDPDFCKLLSRKKLSWDQYDALLRSLYDSIRTKDYYTEYMAAPSSDIRSDAALWKHIFEDEFEDNSDLEAILEEKSIWWNDDLSYALGYCCRTMEDLGAGRPWRLPELYMSQMPGSEGKDSDRDFVRGTVRRGVTDFEDFCSEVSSLTPKWDKNRICVTDLALIVCGMAEAAAFPDMPARVIINEYVEISKYYSTPESGAFVNGLLNKLIIK